MIEEHFTLNGIVFTKPQFSTKWYVLAFSQPFQNTTNIWYRQKNNRNERIHWLLESYYLNILIESTPLQTFLYFLNFHTVSRLVLTISSKWTKNVWWKNKTKLFNDFSFYKFMLYQLHIQLQLSNARKKHTSFIYKRIHRNSNGKIYSNQKLFICRYTVNAFPSKEKIKFCLNILLFGHPTLLVSLETMKTIWLIIKQEYKNQKIRQMSPTKQILSHPQHKYFHMKIKYNW